MVVGLSAPAIAQPSLRRVRLLVVRTPAGIPANNCVSRCIRGRLYDVSDVSGSVLPAAIATSGRPPICDVIERPWAGNAAGRSAIPKGIYPATIRTDESKTWMKDKPDRAWRLELSGVPGGRSRIQFHYGLDETWSEGCLIVGRTLSQNRPLGSGEYCRLDGPEGAVAAIRNAVKAPGNDTGRIEVIVADLADLFPNRPTGC